MTAQRFPKRNDFWLNEGWTTYAEQRITEILEGKDAVDLNAVYDEKRTYEIMQRVGMNAPVTYLKVPNDGKDGDSMTSQLAYTKGCFFLKECEHAVGRERFDAFIQKIYEAFSVPVADDRRVPAFSKSGAARSLRKSGCTNLDLPARHA